MDYDIFPDLISIRPSLRPILWLPCTSLTITDLNAQSSPNRMCHSVSLPRIPHHHWVCLGFTWMAYTLPIGVPSLPQVMLKSWWQMASAHKSWKSCSDNSCRGTDGLPLVGAWQADSLGQPSILGFILVASIVECLIVTHCTMSLLLGHLVSWLMHASWFNKTIGFTLTWSSLGE